MVPPPKLCDYNLYNSGTDANYHRFPIYTSTIDECKKYFKNGITESDYSKLHNGGYLCIPWCDVNKNQCSSDRIKKNPNGNWIFDDKTVNFSSHLGRYTPKGNFGDKDNRCVIFTDMDKSCNTVDLTCCGKGFGNGQGEYCDGLNNDKIFYPSCYGNSPNNCCGHGKCMDGKCKCDEGYSSDNCCECIDGYHKDTNGKCVKNDINCCDFSTGNVNMVQPDQCIGPNKSEVNSSDDCYPKDKYYCLNDYSDCIKIDSSGVWNDIKNKPGIVIDEYEKCFPQGLYWCDSDKNCNMGFLRILYNVSRKNPIILCTIILCIIYIFLLFFQLNKKK